MAICLVEHDDASPEKFSVGVGVWGGGGGGGDATTYKYILRKCVHVHVVM